MICHQQILIEFFTEKSVKFKLAIIFKLIKDTSWIDCTKNNNVSYGWEITFRYLVI